MKNTAINKKERAANNLKPIYFVYFYWEIVGFGGDISISIEWCTRWRGSRFIIYDEKMLNFRPKQLAYNYFLYFK